MLYLPEDTCLGTALQASLLAGSGIFPPAVSKCLGTTEPHVPLPQAGKAHGSLWL